MKTRCYGEDNLTWWLLHIEDSLVTDEWVARFLFRLITLDTLKCTREMSSSLQSGHSKSPRRNCLLAAAEVTKLLVREKKYFLRLSAVKKWSLNPSPIFMVRHTVVGNYTNTMKTTFEINFDLNYAVSMDTQNHKSREIYYSKKLLFDCM